MARLTQKERIRGFGISRLEAFSDGVFAIAITILVLEIGVPKGAEEDLLKALLGQWPAYLAYFVSFATIGAAWFAHSAITEHLERSDRGLARINLLILMFVSFLPFPSKLLAEFIGNPSQERVAATLYGTVLFLITILLSFLWKYAQKNKLVKAESGQEDIDVISARFTPSLYGYAVIIIVGLFIPGIAVFGYLAIAVFILFPTETLRKILHK
ncbi:MAG: TMEM175 family protein [Candidatus Saccharibacteria bacterium]|nr:TMEM175 family protein [Candidatus Saccharibacteria bacterium]